MTEQQTLSATIATLLFDFAARLNAERNDDKLSQFAKGLSTTQNFQEGNELRRSTVLGALWFVEPFCAG